MWKIQYRCSKSLPKLTIKVMEFFPSATFLPDKKSIFLNNEIFKHNNVYEINISGNRYENV